MLHIGTRALWNRFHNRHLKNQTICNRRTNNQRIFMWIQNDTLCLCRDLNNTLGIFLSCESRHKEKKCFKNVILKPRNPVYNWFLETEEVQRELLNTILQTNLLHHHNNLHYSFLYAHLSAHLDNEASINIWLPVQTRF